MAGSFILSMKNRTVWTQMLSMLHYIHHLHSRIKIRLDISELSLCLTLFLVVSLVNVISYDMKKCLDGEDEFGYSITLKLYEKKIQTDDFLPVKVKEEKFSGRLTLILDWNTTKTRRLELKNCSYSLCLLDFYIY